MAEQSESLRARIASYLGRIEVDAMIDAEDEAQLRAWKGHGDRYPELSEHLLVGSRNKMAASIVTDAAQQLQRAILANMPDTELRNDAMRHVVTGYILAMSALSMIAASAETP